MAGKIKALLTWCKNITAGYRDVNVVNMTTSWKDGLAFCALIHHFRPDLINFDSLSKENVFQNNQLAFQTAENELGIAALLDAEDMVAMKVPDKLSIITYVSQYYNCLHNMQPSAPLPNSKASKRSASPVSQPEQTNVKKKPLALEVKKTNQPLISAERPQTFSSCEICRKKVHLVERYIDEGKVYHRLCHRTKSLSGMYKRSATTANNLPDSKKSFDNLQDKIKNDQMSDSKPKPDFTTPAAHTGPPAKSEVSSVKVSRVLAMSHLFETKSKESLGLKTTSDQPKKQDSSSDISGDGSKNNFNSKPPTILSEKSDVELSNKSEKIAEEKTDSTIKESERNKTPLSETENTVDQCSQAQVVTTTPNHSNEVDAADNFPSLVTSLADAKQQKTDNEKRDLETKVEKVKPETPKNGKKEILPSKVEKAKPETPKNGKKEILPSKVEKVKPETPKNGKKEILPSKVEKAKPETPESDKKEILPSLLSSLVDSQKGEIVVGKKDETEDTSPFNPFAPLISELPKVPETKPRIRTTSTEGQSSTKPLPRKRSNESKPYDDELNPFGSADESKPSENTERPPYNASLNPFGDDDNVEEQILEKSRAKSLNPFEEDDEEENAAPAQNIDAKSPSSRVVDSKLRAGTVNIVNSRDARLNPFTDEYEDRKEPPVPPSRRKTRAPTPPKGPKSAAQNTPSPIHAKPAAPVWKTDVEQKMEEMNKFNQTDTKFVEKTSNTSLSSGSSESTKSAQKPPKGSTKRKPAKPINKPSRPAPGFGFPLVKRKVKSQMTEEEITDEMAILDLQLKDLENKGVKLEELLRDEMEIDMETKSESDQLLGEWFELVQEKNKLVRRETDLVFLMQQQRLEQEHADVEFMIRKLMNKPDSEKTGQEKVEEGKLLEKLMEIVERRNTIINSIEEARLKEEEEDAAYDQLRSNPKDYSLDPDSAKKKKKSKVKRIFSKKKKTPKLSVSEDVSSPS